MTLETGIGFKEIINSINVVRNQFSVQSFEQKYAIKGWSPGLVVMGDDSCSKGCGFELQCCKLDVHLDIFHIDLLENCIVCLKRLKINEKEAGVGPFFKKNMP